MILCSGSRLSRLWWQSWRAYTSVKRGRLSVGRMKKFCYGHLDFETNVVRWLRVWRPVISGGKSRLLKAFMTGRPGEDAGRSPSFTYTLKFALQLRKITKENTITVPEESLARLVLSIWPSYWPGAYTALQNSGPFPPTPQTTVVIPRSAQVSSKLPS
jgi:hypothetical protein